MSHQWWGYLVVALLSIGAGVAIAGGPNNVPVAPTIVAPNTTVAPVETVPETTVPRETTAPSTTGQSTND
jgi:hypothetical protein